MRMFAALWRTPHFQQSHADGGFIFEIIDQFARLPRLFCDETDDALERAHFSSWWGVLMNRTYDNPVIEDLYRLHEIFHAATMPYFPGIGFDAFHRKMEDNELKASVCSEIRVYFEIPGLREASFPHPIYADRFLDNPEMRLLWEKNKLVAIETLQEARRDVMVSKPEHEMDLAERWIRRFALQNRQWSTSGTTAIRRWSAPSTICRSALLAVTGPAPVSGIVPGSRRRPRPTAALHVPFRHEATMFASIYWSNRRRYDAEIAKG